jgi:NitT/TauT family transport system substrate-binding protein
MNLIATLLARTCALMIVALACSAQAQTQPPIALTLAGLRTIQFLPVQYAQKQGYFKREGLDVNLISLNSGPAVISAVASGSAQVGYASPVPIIFARAQSQPVRIFDALTMSSPKGDVQWNWLVASEKSGIKSIKDLAGKTIALNTMGGACELQFRENMAKAGVSFDSAKHIVVPYPQMQAALQLGNADAACVVEPFRTSIHVSPEIKGRELSNGTLADRGKRYPEDILFVRDDWGKANMEALRRIHRGVAAALADFKKDPTLLRRVMTEDFKLSGAVVSLMSNNMEFANVPPAASDIKPLVEALTRHQMLKTAVNPDDVILQVR